MLNNCPLDATPATPGYAPLGPPLPPRWWGVVHWGGGQLGHCECGVALAMTCI